MTISESVLINADAGKVWETFTDLLCWKDWNTVMTDVSSGSPVISEGETLRFCFRPFSVPLDLAPVVEEVVPYERVVWSGSKYGVTARHEFIFKKLKNGLLLTSSETFSGMPVRTFGFMFPEREIRELTVSLLDELKKASEARP